MGTPVEVIGNGPVTIKITYYERVNGEDVVTGKVDVRPPVHRNFTEEVAWLVGNASKTGASRIILDITFPSED